MTITFMIKINKSAIVIISLSLFAFIAYNVMTVDAAEKKDCSSVSKPDDDFYCDEFNWALLT